MEYILNIFIFVLTTYIGFQCQDVSEVFDGSIDFSKNDSILKTISNSKFNIATLSLEPKRVTTGVTYVQKPTKLLPKTMEFEYKLREHKKKLTRTKVLDIHYNGSFENQTVPYPDSPSLPAYIIIPVTLILILLVLTFLVICLRFLRKRNQREAFSVNFNTDMNKIIGSDLTMQKFISDLKYDKRYEFPKNKLKLGELLGSGNFGIVQKAVANEIVKSEKKSVVAVKTVKDSDNVDAFRCIISEMKIMIHLGRHLNIVSLLGAVTKNLSKGELLLIVEYCAYGNLQIFLKNNRNIFVDEIDAVTDLINMNIKIKCSSTEKYLTSIDSTETDPLREKSEDINKPYKTLTTSHLICWAYQISLGVGYISKRNIMHGDLAARNVLLTDGNIVKICDFGLAKDISNQYGKYIKKQEDQLPLKWLAPESLKDLEFTIKSDVWSFGILLWELFSLGSNPYPGINPKGLEFLNLLTQGYRMERPQYANQAIYEIMLKCWETEPLNRPTFSDLASRLENFLEKDIYMHYLQMNRILEKENEEHNSAVDKNGYMIMLNIRNSNEKLYVDVGEQTALYVNTEVQVLNLEQTMKISTN